MRARDGPGAAAKDQAFCSAGPAKSRTARAKAAAPVLTHTMYDLTLPNQLDFVPDFDSSWMFLVFIGKVFLAGVLLGIFFGMLICRLLAASCGRRAQTRAALDPAAAKASPESGGPPPRMSHSSDCSAQGIGCNVTTQSQTTYKWYASKPHFHPLVEGLHGAWVQRAKAE